jgi:hypothetical protein
MQFVRCLLIHCCRPLIVCLQVISLPGTSLNGHVGTTRKRTVKSITDTFNKYQQKCNVLVRKIRCFKFQYQAQTRAY